jgi:hypothetical protein
MNYPKSTIQAAAFIKRNWKGCKSWKKDRLLGWVQWFASHGRMIGIREGGKIAGVALFRFVDYEKDIATSEYTDTDGDICYIALCVSKAKRIIRALYTILWNAGLSSRRLVCWARDKYSERPNIVSVAQLGRRLGYG